MNKMTAALCFLMLAAPLASAQGTNPGYKAPPPPKKEQTEKDKKSHSQIGDCSKKIRDDGIKPNSPDFSRLMGNCLKG